MSPGSLSLSSRPVRRPGKQTLGTLIACLMLLSPGGFAFADSPAEALLQKTEETYRNTRTLTADFTATTLYPTYYRDSQERGTISLERPSKVSIRLNRYRKIQAGDRWEPSGNIWSNVSDGKTLTTLLEHPDSAQYRKTSAPAAPDRLLENVEVLRGFFTGKLAGSGDIVSVGVKQWEGTDYQVVESRTKEKAASAQWFIGADGFVHRYVAEESVKGQTVRREVVLRNIRQNSELSPSLFTVLLPADAQPFERTAPQELLSAGTQAPDFTVRDTSGKSVRLSDFRGKVVVLKFFATWCGSCRQSLPHTESEVSHFADQNVTTLLVNIWDSEKALRNWQSKNGKKYPHLRFTVDTAPQGKDIATTLYHVSTTPTLYVIDAQGKVVASQAGYNGPTNTLRDAIRAAQSP